MPLHGLRVLVVEREILIALDLQRVLLTAGASEVILARAAGDAVVGRIDAPAFELAIVDAQLGAPEMVALVNALTEQGIPVVVASADARIADAFTASAFLEKPFAETDVVTACQAALAAMRTH